jgi:hypothetical protein
LELEVLEDMNPLQIQWDKVLQLEPAESVRAYVEDLSTPDRWWETIKFPNLLTPHYTPLMRGFSLSCASSKIGHKVYK